MIKNWDLKRKHEFFVKLTANLSESRSSIPSIKLFRGLIKDQKDKAQYANYYTNYNNIYSSPLRIQTNVTTSYSNTSTVININTTDDDVEEKK